VGRLIFRRKGYAYSEPLSGTLRRMIHLIDVDKLPALNDYSQVAQLTQAVEELRSEASTLVPRLRGRRVWMVNSTAQGGGVAEMLPRLVSMLNELGVDTRWAVMNTDRAEFFPLTKRIHNLVHGSGRPEFTAEDRAVYDAVSREVAAELKSMLSPNDVLVVHDPQPAGMGSVLKKELGLRCVWRCHIGLDDQTEQTRAAWEFLESYLRPYDHFVFTASEYIPNYLSGHVSIIHPALDPFSHKNRELSVHKLVGILANASLVPDAHPVMTDPFDPPAMRVQSDGSFAPATCPEDIGLLYRPTVTQVSRWDKLKGWQSLLEGFVLLKHRTRNSKQPERQHRALEYARLVLAGPEPSAVQDDPEAVGVLERLIESYKALEPEVRRDVVLLSLPMSSRKTNALMVNTLQHCSSVVVQNSLREGFGLTVTEAMWKRVSVLGTTACGIRQQIRHGVDGHLNAHPEDPAAIADALEGLLTNALLRMTHARRAQRRVHDKFLVFRQVAKWLRVLTETVDPPHYVPPPVV
jgi:trehalose synthase